MFSTHTLGEAQRFADRVIVLDRGELLFDGPPQAFMRQVDGRGPDMTDLINMSTADLIRSAFKYSSDARDPLDHEWRRREVELELPRANRERAVRGVRGGGDEEKDD